MDDLRFGRTIRALRIRKGVRQRDVAEACGLSDATVSRLERGDLDALSLRSIRQVAAVLEVTVDLHPRSRGADLDRLLSHRHSVLAEAVSRSLGAAGWQVRPEVSFSIFGERGVVDLLAWHPSGPSLLVIELKTELVDVGEVLGTLDRKRRLAPRIAATVGWTASTASTCLLLVDSHTNRRRVGAFSTVLRGAFPADGRHLRGWLRSPRGSIAALAFWPDRHPGQAKTILWPAQRVRVVSAARLRARPSVVRRRGDPVEP